MYLKHSTVNSVSKLNILLSNVPLKLTRVDSITITSRASSHLLLLFDTSKAFDGVNYNKLFNFLIEKEMCPLVVRLLALMYNKQQAHW